MFAAATLTPTGECSPVKAKVKKNISYVSNFVSANVISFTSLQMYINVHCLYFFQLQMEAKKHHHESVSKLEDKVKDLERKCEEQSSQFSRLSYELSAIRLDASTHFRTLSSIGGSPQDGPKGLATSNGNNPDKWRQEEEDVARAMQENRRPVPSGAEQVVHSELPRGECAWNNQEELIKYERKHLRFFSIILNFEARLR